MNNPLQRTRKRILDGTDTPSWWIGVQVLLGVAFLVYLLFSFGTDDAPAGGADPVAGQFGAGTVTTPDGPPRAGGGAVAAPDAPAAPDGTESPSAPTEAPSGASATVAAAGGGTLEVPGTALSVARSAAAAHMTGDWSAVALVEGTTPPTTGGEWSDPVLGDVVARRINDALLQFLVDVDPDGPGAEPARSVTVHVARTDSGWSYRGQ